MRRRSWLEAFSHYPTPAGLSNEDLRRNIASVDERLQQAWNLGENIFLACTSQGRRLLLLSIPHYLLAEYVSGARTIRHSDTPERFMRTVLSGSRWLAYGEFEQLAAALGIEPLPIDLPFAPEEGLAIELTAALVQRYGVAYTEDRPVILVDIVGFARFHAMEQVVLLQSLSHSLNSAYFKLAAQNFRIQFARSTTGDGFYIWNRSRSFQASADLYRLMLLLLADNAIAQRKSRTRTVPRLRTAFHFGPHYEFYQSEGLSPTLVSYLVGEVTIELARLIERAMPGQILLGDFVAEVAGDDGTPARVGTAAFVERMREAVWHLKGISLAGEAIREIKCYVTGPGRGDGTYAVARYHAVDKHGFRHGVFNAKLSVYRESAAPIFLGVPDDEIKQLEVAGLMI